MISKEAIKTDVPAKDWKEAVRVAGELLVKVGAAEPRYVDAMIKTVMEMGPYIVITKGIAFPHARPSEGAKKPAIAIVKLKNPVNFGNPDNDPVHLIIAFTASDDKTHVTALSQLAKVLMDEKNVKALLQARSVDEIYEIFEKALARISS
ncbi:MAG: PTS sugar transporter subunit IIA [Candidatus Njordarchaeales archaeon]